MLTATHPGAVQGHLPGGAGSCQTFPEVLQGSSGILHPPGLNVFPAVGYKNSLLHSNLMRCLKRGFKNGIKVTVTAFKLQSANIFLEQTALLHPY